MECCLLQEGDLKHGCKFCIPWRSCVLLVLVPTTATIKPWLKDHWKPLQSKVKCCAGRFRVKLCWRSIEFPQKSTGSLWSSEGQELFPMFPGLVFVSVQSNVTSAQFQALNSSSPLEAGTEQVFSTPSSLSQLLFVGAHRNWHLVLCPLITFYHHENFPSQLLMSQRICPASSYLPMSWL